MISPDTIALVRERTDLVALIGESMRLTRQGRKFIGLCPFHKEKTPSFHVNPDRGLFYCFGCKETGSAIDFVMKTDGLTFPEAIRALADRAGVNVEEEREGPAAREAQAARKAKDDLYAVNALAATYFERCLWGGAGGVKAHAFARYALAELARRGLIPGGGTSQDPPPCMDTLQAFRIGYAPFGWDGLASFLRDQGVSPITAERVGLLVPKSSGAGHYDRFRHRLMFAVIDVMGRVVAFSGRALADPAPDELAALGLQGPRTDPEQAPAKYINSPESPIYVKGDNLFGLHQARQAVRQAGRAIVVEGNFDVVALHARGIANVVAPLGTAFTTAQGKLLKRFAPNVVILFDGDAAGRKATRAARGACREAGLTASVATLPPGLDPDDLARRHGPEGIARLVKAARGMLEHLIDEALDGDDFGGATMTEKLSRVKAVAQLLAEEDDPNLRTMAKTYADRLSQKLVLMGQSPADLRQLEQVIERAVSGRAEVPQAGAQPHDRARSRAQVDEIGRAVLGALLDFPELLDDPEVERALADLEGDMALAISALRQRRDGQKGLYAGEFLAQIAPPIHSFAAGRLASPVFERPVDARTELLTNARKLKHLGIKRENAAAVEHLHRAGSMGDAALEDAVLREVARRAREKLGLMK